MARTSTLVGGLALGVACGAAACSATDDGAPAGSASASGARTPARVQRVVDGDTLKVRLRDGRRVTVRVIGIDTPETKKPDTPIQCGGPQASAAMAGIVIRGSGRRARGRDVVLVRDPTQDAKDRFGRTLAYVDLDGRDVGEQLVAAGWARAVAYDGRYQRQSRYDRAQSAARRGRLGIWGLCRGRG